MPVNGPIRNDEDAYVTIEAIIAERDVALCAGYAIYDDAGRLLYWSYQTDVAEDRWPKLEVGKNVLCSKLPRRLLNSGRYRLELIASQHCRAWICEPGKKVPTIYLSIEGGLSDSPYWMATRPGILGPEIDWKRNQMVRRDSIPRMKGNL